MAKNYELVIVWETGEKEVYEYATQEEANIIMQGYKTAFGNQLWCGTRKKVIP